MELEEMDKIPLQELFKVDQDVEVLFMDKGFVGPWHTGKVTGRGIDRVDVQFTHLFDDIKCPEFYFHSIRPQPSEEDAAYRGYGVCVDAKVNDAWWEGVLFDDDREGRSLERLVFFPDEGDICKIKISPKHLRLTQDWDDIGEYWKPRQEWKLLRAINTLIKEETVPPVSVRQLWYDLRSTKRFKDEIGLWHRGDHYIWHELVSELIQPLLLSTAVDGKSADENKIQPRLLSTAIDGKSADENKIQPLVLSTAIDGKSSDENMMVDDQDNKLNKGISKYWTPADVTAEHCADFMTICRSYLTSSNSKKRSKDEMSRMTEKLRRHLVHRGWEIKFNNTTRSRYRYWPPGKSNRYFFQSLTKVCEHFTTNEGNRDFEDGSRSIPRKCSSDPLKEEGRLEAITKYFEFMKRGGIRVDKKLAKNSKDCLLGSGWHFEMQDSELMGLF